MPSKIVMPKLGLTMTEGTLTEWIVDDGAAVTKGQPVASIETDKIETEIEADADGLVHQIGTTGSVFACGVLLGWVLQEGEDPPINSDDSTIETPDKHVVEKKVNTKTNTQKTKGGRVAASPAAKRLAREMGIDLSSVTGSGPDGRIVIEDVEALKVDQETNLSKDLEIGVASQAAVNTARKLGVNIDEVSPTSEDNLIRKADVETHVRNKKSVENPQSEQIKSSPIVPIGKGQKVGLSGMRKVISERMHSSLREMAQLTLHLDVEMDKAVSLRKELKDEGHVLSYTDMIIAASARALKIHPTVNSQLLERELLLLDEVNIGMAVALDEGLVVPVVRNADQLSLSDISLETSRLATVARDGKMSLNDLEGGTFSVTSLGMFGVDGFTPVINPPNVAILGVGQIRDDVAWDNEIPHQTSRMVISLSWDHRVLDGAPAAEFTNTIKTGLENPETLLESN